MILAAWRNPLGIMRYGSVSVLCILGHNMIMILGFNGGWGFVLPNIVSFLSLSVAAFLLHCRLTYGREPSWAGLFHYMAAMAMNLPLSVILTWIALHWLGQSIVTAALACTVLMSLWNLLHSHWATARRRTTRAKEAG
jgi:hypothetical protein